MAMSEWGPGGGSGTGRDEPFGRHAYDDGAPAAFRGPGEAAATSGRDYVPRFEDSGELALGDDDIRLPWLEGDEEEFEETGFSTAQVVSLAVIGLAALALIVAVAWWAQRDRPDTQLVADGATIEAPDTPYKTRPTNPGGEVLAGTGDTSFAVAEGQSRQVRIGDGTAPPPVVSASPAATGSAPAAPDVTGVGVQVGAYTNRETAEKGWTALTTRYAEVLSGVPHRIVEGSADIGTVYRLQAVPGDAAAANHLCTTLKAAGLSCQVKR